MVIRGKGKWEDEIGKGGQIYGNGEKLDFSGEQEIEYTETNYNVAYLKFAT